MAATGQVDKMMSKETFRGITTFTLRQALSCPIFHAHNVLSEFEEQNETKQVFESHVVLL